MGISVPIAGTNPNGGSGFSENSLCHLVIESVEDKIAEQQQVCITFLSVASTVESQVGKKRMEFFSFAAPKPGKNPPVNKFLELACALGIYSKPQWKADVEANRNPAIELENLVGRSCCAPVVIRKFDEKYWTKRLEDARKHGDTTGAEKAEAKLSERRDDPSVGGEYGYTFYAIGDADSDKIPLDQVYISVPITGPLPTKMGTMRVRGASSSPAAPLAPPAGHQQTAPPATAGGSFF